MALLAVYISEYMSFVNVALYTGKPYYPFPILYLVLYK